MSQLLTAVQVRIIEATHGIHRHEEDYQEMLNLLTEHAHHVFTLGR